MNPNLPVSSPSSSLPVVAGIVACAACCTLPILFSLLFSAGVGSAVFAWFTTRSAVLGMAAFVISASIAGFIWWRSRRSAAAPPMDQCSCRW